MMSKGGACRVRAHRQDGAALRMEYHHEADQDADRAPQQVGDPEAEHHPLLAIDAGRLLGRPRRRGYRREESYTVALDSRDQVVFLGEHGDGLPFTRGMSGPSRKTGASGVRAAPTIRCISASGR